MEDRPASGTGSCSVHETRHHFSGAIRASHSTRTLHVPYLAVLFTGAVAVAVFWVTSTVGADEERSNLVFSCAAGNDLYRVMTAAGTTFARYGSAREAIGAAPEGAGVLVLADGYPQKTTVIEPAAFDAAAKKKLRLYVEYPDSLPGVEVGKPRRAQLERAVVVSDTFGRSLQRMRLLVIHDCHFVELQAADLYLVLAKVAGYDTAVFGLKDTTAYPILFEHPRGRVLVSTTKLSQFVTARYAPKGAWQAVWKTILNRLQPGKEFPNLDWTLTVRPTFGRDAELPTDAASKAIVRGIDWHSNARMLMHKSWKDQFTGGYRLGPAPDRQWPAGDGQFAVLEGFSSRIGFDGKQPVRWWLRTDSIGESSLAFALRSKLDGDERSARIAANLLDWVYFTSGLNQKDPNKATFGLTYWAPDSKSLYGDNSIKIILGCMGTAAVLDEDRWDEVLLAEILGNFRTSGAYGYRIANLNYRALLRNGWQHFWQQKYTHFQPHYQAWLWSSYLWLYDKTEYEPLLERSRTAICMMMERYPDNWRWTNGIQQERGRMLLPLAWLIRVEDKPQYRAWLKRLATDMQKCQDASGAIREELGDLSKGGYRPPRSNAEYGTREASAIQQNGDPMADMLYTCNFTFLGLHEAYAATGDPQYREMADKLAKFFVRIQVCSEAHPELDGAWFRSFDYEKWDYWGSNADAGWGAWSIEVGWTQAWIPTVLALRELDLNLWEITKDSKIQRHFDRLRRQMLPDEAIASMKPTKVVHTGIGSEIKLANAPSRLYPGKGATTLVDGLTSHADHGSGEWLGFHGNDLEAVIDLGRTQPVRQIAARFLRSTGVGIYLPAEVGLEVSEDGKRYRTVAAIKPPPRKDEPGPLVETVQFDKLKLRARYVRVVAKNVATIPAGHPAAGRKAWLFADEIMIDSVPEGRGDGREKGVAEFARM